MRPVFFPVLIVLQLATVAWADGPDEDDNAPQGPAANFWIDGSIATTAGIGWLVLARQHATWARTRCPCRPNDVNGFDRIAVTQKWRAGERFANIGVALTLLAPAGLLALSAPDVTEYSSDVLMLAESVVLAGLATQSVKTAVSRPYPYMYGPAAYPEQNADGNNYASFWSGHTAVSMAATVTFAYLFSRRHPRSAWRWVAWALGPVVALSAGYLQISAGNHFPTDVMAGAVAGGAIGYLNPLLHEW